MNKTSKKIEEEILIPKERIPILIGKNKEIKNKLEKKGGVKLKIDSEEGSVIISSESPLMIWIVKNIIEAIGRGFNPEIAQKLFKEENIYELINIKDFAGQSKKKLIRLRGRVIGQEGKSKQMIQKYTNTDISVYGKTVGIIGHVEDVELARKAIEMLLTGAKHGTVYQFILKAGEING